MQCVTERRLIARRGVLLAGTSLIALAVACSDLRAQSATQSAPPQGQWSTWSESGLTGHPATDPALGLPPLGPFANMAPGVGWESALGFDYRLGQCEAPTATLLVKANPAPCWQSPYHIIGQFRYGQNYGGSDPVSRTSVSIPLLTSLGTSTPGVANATGSATLNQENHWLVDLGFGRNFALGSGNAQAQLGVRVAEIASTANAAGALQACIGTSLPCSTTEAASGNFSFQSRSQFLGVRPRLGVDGSQPLGGSWAFEYLGGVAVLFGNRSLSASQTLFATSVSTATIPSQTSVTALSASGLVGILNLDAQAGISYWLTHNFKMTA